MTEILNRTEESILSIASSVLKHYGAQCDHSSLPLFDSVLMKNFKNVVVMLFDGMGTSILEKHLNEQTFFRRNQKSVITSVFPPTTTAATVAIETGLSPIEHGWLGWSLYFSELDANINIFPNTISGSDGISAADYHVAGRYLPNKSIFEKITEATKGEVSAINISAFSEYQSQNSKEICDSIKTLCAETGRKYIYSYWHQPDFHMHDYGTTHSIITADIKKFNNEVEEMCNKINDSIVIVTADHGLVDTEWRFITDYPEIAECLKRKPSIESRAATFFIKDSQNKKFEKAFTESFGDHYLLFSKQEVIENKLFGVGTPNPRSYGFIGDYFAVATGNISIECSPSTRHDLFKAAHAGLTDDEMNVPLIIVETIPSLT